jgi:hypothetical protein
MAPDNADPDPAPEREPVRSWRTRYALVLIALAVEILLFTLLTRFYR